LLPYDRDSLLRELESRAPTPRPSTARLDSLFQEFRGPFTELLRASERADRLRGARDSVRARLDALTRDDPSYSALYDRHRTLEDSLTQAIAEVEGRRATLASARERVAPEVDSLRAEIRTWQDIAYRSYDSITSALARRTADGALTDSTGADGWATVKVPSGGWWIYARAVNLLDPNAEWYWNLPVVGDTIRLSPSNGRSRPRI